MGIWQKISAWWSQDDVKDAAEAVRDDSQAERDLAAEDYEGRKDDQYLKGDIAGRRLRRLRARLGAPARPDSVAKAVRRCGR